MNIQPQFGQVYTFNNPTESTAKSFAKQMEDKGIEALADNYLAIDLDGNSSIKWRVFTNESQDSLDVRNAYLNTVAKLTLLKLGSEGLDGTPTRKLNDVELAEQQRLSEAQQRLTREYSYHTSIPILVMETKGGFAGY